MPLVFSGPPDVVLELEAAARASAPEDYGSVERAGEDLRAFAEIAAAAQAVCADWARQARIATSEGAFLVQHARDRGISPQGDETDPELRERLRTAPDALSYSLLRDVAQSIVDAAGVIGTVAMLELRRDRARLGWRENDGGTGGTFALGATASFSPSAGFEGGRPPFYAHDGAPTCWLVVTGAAAAGNNGTFQVTGLSAAGVEFANPAAVAGLDLAATWALHRKDRRGNWLTQGGGAPESGTPQGYFSRGYRMAALRNAIVMMLPYGTTEATRLAVLEMLRQRKAAGVVSYVERRLTP